MIQQIEKFLQRLGIIAPFDKDDVLNAEIEDKARDNEKAIRKLQSSMARRFQTNEQLRQSIKIAKRRTNSFEQFEQLIAGRNDD